MKRSVCLVLTLLALCAAMSFASGSKEQAAAPSYKVSGPGQLPIVSEKVTLKFFAVQDPRVENIETTNWFTQFMEKRSNVHIEWQLVPQAGLDEKRKLVLASGDYPDVLYGAGVTSDELVTYGSQGVFVNLKDLIDKQGYEIKKVFAKHPTTKASITAPDGGIYSMPYINQCYHCSMSQKMWINRDWLSKLKLAMPTTTDEFRAVLTAFKDKDPNGNGKKDEIPLSGAIKDSWNAVPYDYLMNAFIYNDGGTRLFVSKGKVDFAANKPEWREGLRYVRRLYQDGLIDPAGFTQDQAQLQRLGENPDVVILGASGGGWPGCFATWNSPSNRTMLYAILPPLKGPGGVWNTPFYPQDPGTGNFTITKACKSPEVAVRWADQFYNAEIGADLNYGEKGVDWDWAKPGDVGVNGKPAIWKQLVQLVNPQSKTWYMWGIFNYDDEWRLGTGVDAKGDVYEPANLELLLYQGTKSYEPAKPAEYLPTFWMTREVSNEVAQLATPIQDYVMEWAAKFIVGERSLDADWDAYVKEYDRMGLARFVQLHQNEYDKFIARK